MRETVLGNTSSLLDERIEMMERIGFLRVDDQSMPVSVMEHSTPNRSESKFIVSSLSDSSSNLPQANRSNSHNVVSRSTFNGHAIVVDDKESNTSSEDEDDWSYDEE